MQRNQKETLYNFVQEIASEVRMETSGHKLWLCWRNCE